MYVQEAICHAVDKRAVLEELWRVLKRGGSLALLEYCDNESEQTPSYHAWLDEWFMPSLITTREFLEFCDHKGENGKISDISGNMEPSLRRLNQMCTATYPGQWLLAQLRLRSRVQLGNTKASMSMWKSFTRRDWSYYLLSVEKTGAK